MRFCSIATAAELARVRVLVRRLAVHAPGSPVTVLHAETEDADLPEVEGAEVLGLSALGIDSSELRRWRLTRDLRGFVETLKPRLLLHLVDAGGPLVLLDPSRVPVGRVETPGVHGLGLVPRLSEAVPLDGLEPSEATLVRAGVVHTGVVLAGPAAREGLDWWASRIATDAAVPWPDLTPGLFPETVALLTPPGWDVSDARIRDRRLERSDAGLQLAGEPVALVDLTGFDAARPWLLDARRTRDLRTLVSRDPVLREVLLGYAGELAAAGEAAAVAGACSVVDEVVVDSIVQDLAADEVRAAAQGRGSGLDLGDGGTPLREWLVEPETGSGGVAHLGRYLAEFYRRRPDLHFVYPGVRAGDVTGFLDWAELVGIESDGIPRWVVEAGNRFIGRGEGPAPAPPSPVTLVPGVEVVGFLSADLGIGQAARMLVSGLEHAGVPVSTRTWTRTSSRLGVPWEDRAPQPGTRHDTVVLCINADMLPTFLDEDAGPGFCEGRRVIGFWFWELDDFPPGLRPALEPLDEIWVTSGFTADVLRAATDKPVHVLPLPVHSPEPSGVQVPELGDSEVFTFLFVFDYLSVFQRKNPLGLVSAFVEAFPEPGEARLVIKTINRAMRPEHAEHLAHVIADRPDVVVIDRYLSRAELDALMWRADCYVSLHRSEGFGFTMAEEMAIGKPVIATGYSGNMEFMTPANSRPLKYSMVAVPPDADPYPEGSSWAEPRRAHAVRVMRRIHEDPELRERLGTAAAATIAERHSVEALAAEAVRRLRDPAGSPADAHATRPPSERRGWLRRARGSAGPDRG
ncbi:glycosyltransferase [Nocardioides sediminis]|uniref:glycosyltransferase n=1 Tax=Nocardioides sediminis TaxID=433648 RepID=UPI000D300974|nr:glycosyltransferase [Nocardioides sediminis]